MTKTTFLGYVPSLKSKHEATIVNGRAMKSKGGSIRYLLEGEYDGRKTLPKTVSKEDFVKVYGFDAKEAESVVVGSPSPADVEPPAPSEKPFPQEPSNENFSAENVRTGITDDGKTAYEWYVVEGDESITDNNGEPLIRPYDEEEITNEIEYYVNHFVEQGELSDNESLRLHEIVDSHDRFDEPMEYTIAYSWKPVEVKEALGFFDKKDEKEEEKEEPKTQEFTVVLQEGDKLELTDIEEEQAAPDDENTEKEAESPKTRTFVVSSVDYETDEYDQDELDLPQDFTFVLDVDGIHGIGDTTDMQEIADEIVDDISDETGWLVSGFYFQERMPDGTLVDLDAETYEAVQAKVTRPVKEDETEDEEESDEEGLSTGAKVALGVGALAVGAAILGAEDEDPYANETDYSRIYEATSGDGYISHDPIYSNKEILAELKHDRPETTYSWTSSHDVDEDEVEEALEDELGNDPPEGSHSTSFDLRGSKFNEQGVKEVQVDVDMETDYGFGRYMGRAAEHESESDGYTYAYTKGHKDGMDNEVIYRPSIETDREKTIFKKILKQKADTVGNPSPSGPSSTPEPAEATGSEPSNEEFKGENRNLAIGLTAAGVGLVALLGADRIKKLFDRFNL